MRILQEGTREGGNVTGEGKGEAERHVGQVRRRELGGPTYLIQKPGTSLPVI